MLPLRKRGALSRVEVEPLERIVAPPRERLPITELSFDLDPAYSRGKTGWGRRLQYSSEGFELPLLDPRSSTSERVPRVSLGRLVLGAERVEEGDDRVVVPREPVSAREVNDDPLERVELEP